MKLDQSCSSKPPDAHPHRSPACSPSAPCTPFHRFVLVHLSNLEILVRKPIFGAELAVRLVFLRSTDVGLVMSCVRKNVVGFPLFVDHGYFAGGKVLELLLL